MNFEDEDSFLSAYRGVTGIRKVEKIIYLLDSMFSYIVIYKQTEMSGHG